LNDAGTDLTQALADAPHGADPLEKLPAVGKLAEDTAGSESEQKSI